MAANSHVEKLSPLDLVMPATYIRTLLTFKTTSSVDDICDVLNRGLAITATQVPWIAGRVFPASSTTKPHALEVRSNTDAGPPKVVRKGSIAATYKSLSAGGMDPGAIPSELWPVSAMINEKDYETGVSAFSASLFRFSDGEGVGLCVGAHHNATDISGLAELMKLWTENIRSPEAKNQPLTADRCSQLTGALSDELTAAASKPLDDLFSLHPEYSKVPPQLPATFAALKSNMYRIPVAKLNAMKKELGSQSQAPPTTNTILCAALWTAITLARRQRDPPSSAVGTSRLVTAVNGRPRLQWPNPSTPFLGNLVLYSMAKASFEDLLACQNVSNQRLAKICDAVATSQSPSKIDSRHIAEVYSLVDRVENHKTVFPGWDLFNRRDLTITSWANLDLYDLNFGEELGKAEFVRVPYSDADGVCLILPRKKAVGGDTGNEAIDVLVMLNRDDMNTLEQHQFWQSLVA
ncbi:transferase family-domain-containing protein [Annulohypoxylon moriforme]|nr:transferase family-domain-containing protein [Annulohypoxylon moriforme]